MAANRRIRVALTTWFGYHNYGTALQVTALYAVIRGLGYSVDVVDYQPKGKYVARPGAMRLLDMISKAAKKIRGRLSPNLGYSSEARDRLFEGYLRERLTFTDPCPTMAELEGLNDGYSAFVCGSDQIWAPSVFDPHYFLDFAGDDRLKVAYAPSVGLPKVDDADVARQMARLCKRLDVLSTREESGSRIVSDLTGRKVETVLDPTFLIPKENWEEMTSGGGASVNGGPYLLVYMLGRDERQWKRIYGLARRLGLTVRVVPAFRGDLRREGCIAEPVGPCEFVSLISSASYVCTDSFHGVAFSISFGRDFCVFDRFKQGDIVNQNSRIYNILDKVGLRDRLVTDGVTDEQLVRPIGWKTPHQRLSSERKRSIKWLESSLRFSPSCHQTKNNIERDRTLCCGCTACEVVCPVDAIRVELDGEGFWRARVDQGACVSCGKCGKACPFIEHGTSKDISVGRLYSYKCSDTGQLLSSSSGGASAAIAKSAADGGSAVLGCAFEAARGGAVGRLVNPDDTDGLVSLSGSKYMQSEVGYALAAAAAHDGPLCIIGTPCQVAAARNLLGGRDDVTFVDLICHGVPTRNLYLRYREWLQRTYGIDPGHARTTFRYKPRGWRERYIYTTDGKHEACLHQRRDPFFLMFEAGQCYAGCCYECPWRATSAADVRLGDYWGPKFRDDQTGVSMVLAMTERGCEVTRELVLTGEVEEQPVADYMSYQQTENFPEPVFRNEVLSRLADPGESIQAVCKEFAEPVAKKRDFIRRLDPLRSLAKRLLGKG